MTLGRRMLSYFPMTQSLNWRLLAFLVLFIDVKLAVKLFALVAIYLMQPDFRFGFTLKNSRLPLFYPLVILLALVNWIIQKGFMNTESSLPFLLGIAFWLGAILAIHQLKLFTERMSAEAIVHTLIVFFVINAVVSYAQILLIILDAHSINPYTYQGEYQKYFISTGDYIKGVSFDTSVTNAALNALGVLFFLFRKNILMTLLCMSVLLLTVSNLTNILLFIVLVYVFIFHSDRNQKSVIALCSFLLLLFLIRITPQNDRYIFEVYGKLTGTNTVSKASTLNIPLSLREDSTLGPEEKKQKFAMLYLDSMNRAHNHFTDPSMAALTASTKERPLLPVANIHSRPYQFRDDTTETRKKLLAFIDDNGLQRTIQAGMPGKIIAARQTIDAFRAHPATLLLGNGMGHFSSKLAFRTTALGIAGSYPATYSFIDPAFQSNHLSVYLSYFTANPKLHSVINSPNSVYLQLAGEYGLIGLLGFAIFYIGYFLKRGSLDGYNIAILLLLLGMLCTDYWFEQLSVIPFFELILLLHIKEKTAVHV